MKMKKWIAALAALGVAVGLTACGGKTDAPAESKPQMLIPDSKPVADEQLGQPSQTDPFQGTDIFDEKVEIHRLVEQIDFSAEGVPYSRMVFSYDDAGHLVSEVTDHGENTEVWNDELGVYQYVYGSYNGTVNSVYTWKYDDQGYLIEQVRKYHRDEGGTEFSPVEEFYYAYTFDRNGEIAECRSTGSDGQNLSLYKFTYEDGLITNVKAYAANGKLFQEQTYSYDVWGRLEKETFSEMEGDFSYTYSYDHLGRCEEVNGRGFIYTVEYDEDGNLISSMIDYDNVEITNYTYDDHGNVIAVDYADGTRSEYTYETCEVTREEKECLERQLRMINNDVQMHNNPYRFFYYHLIPNPVW